MYKWVGEYIAVRAVMPLKLLCCVITTLNVTTIVPISRQRLLDNDVLMGG